MGNLIDLTGQRFGRLTVLERDYDYVKEHNLKTKNTYWKCQCDCGTIKFIDVQRLKKGISKSCGCYNREQASNRMKQYNESQRTIKIGDKYGKLTVLSYAGLRKEKSRDKNESWYLCECECGTKKEIRGNDLVNGKVSSCGCISSLGESCIKDILEANNIKYKKEYIFQDLKNPKTNHNLRFDFAIFNQNDEIEYLIEFDGRQHYTGPEATWSHGNSLEDIQFRDNLKNSYCKEHNILLKRIPYTELSRLSYERIISDVYNIN